MEFEYRRELPGGARLQALTFTSKILEGNALGDPVRRSHPVLLPPGGVAKDLPLVTVLVGYTGFGHKIINKGALWGETLVERIGRGMAEGSIPPAVFFWPSCETWLGGSQYLNSPATGDYEDCLLQELIPFVEQRCADGWPDGGAGNSGSGGAGSSSHQIGGPGKRIIMGKSSGGYGALRLVMRNPGFFAAAASHCGDMGFDMSHFRGFADALSCWQKYGGPAAFLKELPNLKLGNLEHAGIEGIAMAACYSPNPQAELGVDLPMDPETGEIRHEIFDRWLVHDPLRMVDDPTCAAALHQLDHLYLDAGHRDEFALQWGLKRFSVKLQKLEIPAQVEFYNGGHFNNDQRYEISLPQILGAV